MSTTIKTIKTQLIEKSQYLVGAEDTHFTLSFVTTHGDAPAVEDLMVAGDLTLSCTGDIADKFVLGEKYYLSIRAEQQ